MASSPITPRRDTSPLRRVSPLLRSKQDTDKGDSREALQQPRPLHASAPLRAPCDGFEHNLDNPRQPLNNTPAGLKPHTKSSGCTHLRNVNFPIVFVAPISVLTTGPVPVDKIPLLPEQRRADVEVCKVLVLRDINVEVLRREEDVSCWWRTQPDGEISSPKSLLLHHTAPQHPLPNRLRAPVSPRNISRLMLHHQDVAAVGRATVYLG